MALDEGAEVDTGAEVETGQEAAGSEQETDAGTAAAEAAVAEAAGAEGAVAEGEEAETDAGEEEREPLGPRLVNAAERAGLSQEDLDGLVDSLGSEKAKAYLEKVATGFDRQSAELGESGKLLRESRRAGAVEEAPFAESGADVSVLAKPLSAAISPEETAWLKEYAPQTGEFVQALGARYEAMRQVTVSLLRRVNEQHGRHVKGELDGFYKGHADMAALFADGKFKTELQRTAQDIWLASQRTKHPRSIGESLEAALWSRKEARDHMQKGAGEKLKGQVRDRQGKLQPRPKRKAVSPEAKGDAAAIEALVALGVPR